MQMREGPGGHWLPCCSGGAGLMRSQRLIANSALIPMSTTDNTPPLLNPGYLLLLRLFSLVLEME